MPDWAALNLIWENRYWATSVMRALTKISALLAWVVVAATATADPQYQIYDIGVVQTGDTASQGFGVSTGGIAVGRSFRSGGTQAFTWTLGGGIVGLPNLSGRSFCVSNSANDSGIVVGTGATTSFGSDRLPVVWQNGVVSQLPLPTGQTLGDANHVNTSGVAVGSVNGGSAAARGDLQRWKRVDHHADDIERKLLSHRVRHQRFRPGRGAGH